MSKMKHEDGRWWQGAVDAGKHLLGLDQTGRAPLVEKQPIKAVDIGLLETLILDKNGQPAGTLDSGDMSQLDKAVDSNAAVLPEVHGKTHTYTFLGDPIGKGGMGIVWKVRREDGVVAVFKRIRSEFIHKGNQEYRERMIQEALVLEEIDSRHFPKLYETDKRGTSMVMEYVDGQTLEQKVRGGMLAPVDAAIIVAEIADGMDHAHERGYIHRDIKPQNIMVKNGYEVKILDLGLVYLVAEKRAQKKRGTRERITVPGMIVGSTPFISPEQFRGKADKPTDVYALGITLYYMLSRGLYPFLPNKTESGNMPEATEQHKQIMDKVLDVNRTYLKLTEINQRIPQELSNFVDTMISYKPEDRPTMAQVRDWLKNFIKETNLKMFERYDELVNAPKENNVSADRLSSELAA